MGNSQGGVTTRNNITRTIPRPAAKNAAPVSGSTTIKLEGATGTNTSKNLGTAVTLLANPQEAQNSTKTNLIDQLKELKENFSEKVKTTESPKFSLKVIRNTSMSNYKIAKNEINSLDDGKKKDRGLKLLNEIEKTIASELQKAPNEDQQKKIFTAFNDVLKEVTQTIKQEQVQINPQEALKTNTKNPPAPETKAKPMQPPGSIVNGQQTKPKQVQTEKVEDKRLKDLKGVDMASFNNMRASVLMYNDRAKGKPKLVNAAKKGFKTAMKTNRHSEKLKPIGEKFIGKKNIEAELNKLGKELFGNSYDPNKLF